MDPRYAEVQLTTGSAVWYTKSVRVQRVEGEEPMVNRKRSLTIIIGIVVVGLLIIGALWTYNDLKAVARINSTNITWKEFNDALKKQSGNQILASLLREELIRQGAKQHNVTVTDEDVEAELDKLAEQFGSQAGLEKILISYGMNLDDLREQVRSTLLLEAIAAKDVTVEEEELKAYYEENKGKYQNRKKSKQGIFSWRMKRLPRVSWNSWPEARISSNSLKSIQQILVQKIKAVTSDTLSAV